MSSKLTDLQIEEIKTKAAEMIEKNQGKKPYGMNKTIGKIYGVTGQSIGQILSGKRRSKKSPKKNGPGIPPPDIPDKEEKETGSRSSYIPKIKFRIPDFDSLKVFLEKNTNDPIFKIVLDRLIIGKRDSGLYQKIYYVIEEMNKKLEYI